MSDQKNKKRGKRGSLGNKNGRIHGLAALRDKFYNANIERLIESNKLPQACQKLVNAYMQIYEQHPNFNETTASLFRRAAFKAAWCDLAEKWFNSNKFSIFAIKNGEFCGSHLSIQYKIFSESLRRDYEALGLLKKQPKVDIYQLFQQIPENE